MVIKRRKPAEPTPSQEPELVKNVIERTFDVEKRQVNIDPVAEKRRKQKVAERLAQIISETREDLIDARQAGEEVDATDMAALGTELLEAKAKSEELKQQLPPE